MNNQILNDNQNDVKYQVVVNGSILAERGSRPLAEAFIGTLATEQQNNATIVTTTGQGKQVLFG